jgi:hypothetical protein
VAAKAPDELDDPRCLSPIQPAPQWLRKEHKDAPNRYCKCAPVPHPHPLADPRAVGPVLCFVCPCDHRNRDAEEEEEEEGAGVVAAPFRNSCRTDLENERFPTQIYVGLILETG